MSAQKEGKAFETFLKTVARQTGWSMIQLPAGAKFIGRGKIIPVKGPFDFIFQKNGKIIFCDAKSYFNDKIAFSRINQDQVVELLKLRHFKAGYIVEFKEINQCGFLHVSRLAALRPRESIEYSDCVPLGHGEVFKLERIFDDDTQEETRSRNT